jgi:hypothetical protein
MVGCAVAPVTFFGEVKSKLLDLKFKNILVARLIGLHLYSGFIIILVIQKNIAIGCIKLSIHQQIPFHQ